MAPEEMAAVLCPTNCAIMWEFITLFVTYFVHNVSATVYYGKKELLDIKTAIIHLGLDKDFFFNKQEAMDLLQTPDRANIPVICKRRRRRQRTQSGMPREDPQEASGKAAITVNITR